MEFSLLLRQKQRGRPLPKALGLNLDICDESAVAGAVKDITAELTSLDVLVNSAGYVET